MPPVALETWLAFAGVTGLVVVSPGPSTLLVVAQRMRLGGSVVIPTIGGDLCANLGQMIVATLGLSLVSSHTQLWGALELLGVGLLAGLGLRQIYRSRASGPTERPARAGVASGFWRGFVVSAANPKAIFFFAALFPAFLVDSRPLAGQIAILGGTFLLLDGLCLAGYGLLGRELESWLTDRSTLSVDRVAGALLLAAAGLLALRSLS